MTAAAVVRMYFVCARIVQISRLNISLLENIQMHSGSKQEFYVLVRISRAAASIRSTAAATMHVADDASPLHAVARNPREASASIKRELNDEEERAQSKIWRAH